MGGRGSGGDGQKTESKNAMAAAVRIMARNPNLAKVVLAGGMQQAGASVAMLFAQQPLQAMHWQSDMAQYSTIFSMAQTVMAIIGSGPFGRFSDRVDRRFAAALYGFFTFLPSWALLVFGATEEGLIAASVMQVVSGVGVSTNAMLVLTNDVTPPAVRGIGFGMFYSVTNAMLFGLQLVPPLLDLSVTHVLYYQVAISASFFILIASMQAKSPDNAEGRMQEVDPLDENPDAEGSPSANSSKGSWNPLVILLRPIIMAMSEPSLRSLCICSALISLASSMLFMVASQYYRSELDLFPYGTAQQQQAVSLLQSLPGEILVIPGYLLMGFLDTKMGSLKLFKLFIPLRAALVLVGACLPLVQSVRLKWFMIPVIDVLTCYGALIYVPLNRLISDSAPRGRIGEAMGAIGQSQQIANQLANVPIAMGLTRFLQTKVGLQKCEWVYYILSSFVGLLAILPAHGIPDPAQQKEDAATEEAPSQEEAASRGAAEALFHVLADGSLPASPSHVSRDALARLALLPGGPKGLSEVAGSEEGFQAFCGARDWDARAGVTEEQFVEILASPSSASFCSAGQLADVAHRLGGLRVGCRAAASTLVSLATRHHLEGRYTRLAQRPRSAVLSRSRTVSCECATRAMTHSCDGRPPGVPRATTGFEALDLAFFHSDSAAVFQREVEAEMARLRIEECSLSEGGSDSGEESDAAGPRRKVACPESSCSLQ